MPDIDLSLPQRSALLILMAEAREVPNAYLNSVRKLDLKKVDRDVLVGRRLIDVRQERRGRPLFLSLTEKGWAEAIAECRADVPARAGAAGAALYAILPKLLDFLEGNGFALMDVFAASDGGATAETESGVSDAADIETRIRQAYDKIATKPGAWISLADLRGALSGVARGDLDQGLIKLNRARAIRLIPESNQKTLNSDERAAAINIGNEDKHLIAIGS